MSAARASRSILVISIAMMISVLSATNGATRGSSTASGAAGTGGAGGALMADAAVCAGATTGRSASARKIGPVPTGIAVSRITTARIFNFAEINMADTPLEIAVALIVADAGTQLATNVAGAGCVVNASIAAPRASLGTAMPRRRMTVRSFSIARITRIFAAPSET